MTNKKPWNLRTKQGKFRSRRSFKMDMALESQEPHEKSRRRKKRS